MPGQVLSLRSLNRATLQRQMLLSRQRVSPLKAIEQLAGLQAQEPRPPFIGLWSRLDGFRAPDLCSLINKRKVVRATSIRGTLHLHSSADYLAFRRVIQPALTASAQAMFRKELAGLDLSKLVATAQRHFDGQPLAFESLREHLARHAPKHNVRVMAYYVRTHLPLVQVPNESCWSFSTGGEFALAESWLSARCTEQEQADDLVIRYLGAFGPASVQDAQVWSGIRGLGETFERLRPKLRTFHDERDRELFDLPKSPRPSEKIPVPVRFLPEFDNLVLAHADRTRLIADEHRPAIVTKNLRVNATFLVDGFVAGLWKIVRTKTVAKLEIKPFEPLAKRVRQELIEEAKHLLEFAEPDAATREVV